MGGTLVYGAYGYTGELVVRDAVRAGLDPILAGRRTEPLRSLARELDLEWRQSTVAGLSNILGDVELLCHCAGPFVDTYEPALEACLETGTHYLDITGEIPVFEGIKDYDDRARQAGVMMLPGAGFDVVPSDCLSRKLHDRFPEGDRLTLAFGGLGTVSAGTAKSAIRMLGDGVPVRENGSLQYLSFGSRNRTIDTGTGRGPQAMTIIPWGDVSTAHHSTGIPNIAVYAPSAFGPTGFRLFSTLQPLLSSTPIERILLALADHVASGPNASERAEGSAFFWGEVTDGERSVTGRVQTGEAYQFTAKAVVEIASRVRNQRPPTGFQTPSSAFGPELVTAVDNAHFVALSDPIGA